MTAMTRMIVLAALAALLAGCATGTGPSTRENATGLWQDHAGPSRDRVVFPRAEAWKQLDGDWVAVRTRANDYFMLRLDPVCSTDLRFGTGMRLAIAQDTRNTLSRFDTVYTSDARCRIQEIRPVDHRALKTELQARGIEHSFIRER
ncbi:MAG: DUF6491 family protein [Candidatus Wenzhouxiangella sp. M2_3B_020]